MRFPAKVSEAIGQEALRLLKEQLVPELESLTKKIEKSKAWEPEAFVDLCDEFRKENPKSKVYQVLAKIQEVEWRGLMEQLL